MTCECGKPVFIKWSGECKTCYHRRYAREHPRRAEPRPRAGTTPASATYCSYNGAHSRVRAARGVPGQHACIDCGDTGQDWAYRNGSEHEIIGDVLKRGRGGRLIVQRAAWSPLVWDYDPMCKDCHEKRDAHIAPGSRDIAANA